MKTRRVLSRLSKCANVRYCKNQMFYGLPLIHNQYWKNSAHYSWHIYQEKLAMKFNKVLWCALWIGDPGNFHNFFVKNYYLNLNFFRALQRALLKNETKKSSQKRCKSTENCLTVDIARDRSKILKKEEEKRKMRKSQTTTFLHWVFYIGKLC